VTLTVGSLFSGIGGLDLGLERAGMRVIWQSEIDPYACRVLANHWPNTPNLGDITRIDWSTIERPDVICGGYPCQPFSYAGNRNGEHDPRHLWPHVFTAVRVLRPRYLLCENVPGHLSMGLDRALADLASIGWDAEWSIVSACSLGAPHMRKRLFVLAYAADGDEPDHLPHRLIEADRDELGGSGGGTWGDGWVPEPEMGRVAHGVPASVVRGPLHALGNAVVPQVAEHIGRMITRTLVTS
jgi:DNA (cytosine-5)-methyltransferase 1